MNAENLLLFLIDGVFPVEGRCNVSFFWAFYANNNDYSLYNTKDMFHFQAFMVRKIVKIIFDKMIFDCSIIFKFKICATFLCDSPKPFEIFNFFN